MRRLLPIAATVLVPLVFTAGCGGAAPPLGNPAGATARLHVGFPARGLVDTIEIDAVDRLPLRTAELIAPNGTATAASYLNVADSPSLATGQFAANGVWNDAVSGNNALAALALTNAQTGTALQSEAQLLAVVSTAEITLPDPVAYRRDWQHYHIRLSFGTPPGQVETRELPAPAPPPPQR